ncbi:MAG: DUF1214 domain-containing protein [Deltaproteobacteria bacterium]|jgi:hypothetical protein|nr:DUF1214 domain-containing protein [Deltaproteobacteria bacterium]MBW2497649.1 DUF1214 domain-containing protein [Deltaproteobacteria bacterium]
MRDETNPKEKVEQVIDGRSWAQFCDILKASGEVILRESSPRSELDRAEGFRYLSRVARMALGQFVEMSGPEAPDFRRTADESMKLGCDNPDSYYLMANISGDHEYRIRGRRGTVPYLSISTYYGGYGSERAGCGGTLESADLEIAEDGSFEVIVSTTPREGNWLPMDPETNQMIVRQTHTDRANESVYALEIERIGADGPPEPLDAATFHDGLIASAQYVRTCANLFADWTESYAEHPNELVVRDVSGAQGDPSLFYYQGYWRLKADEALVIRATPPECDYWNFQVNNYWLESLDYRHHRIDINHTQAHYEPDGSFQLVVAHRDPDVPNWLHTAGHEHGTMGLRWVKATEHPKPDCRVVSLADLK